MCVVKDAEIDRVEREFLGHLVHGDLERHQAGRLARRTHGIAFGEVEHSEPHSGHTIGAGVQQPGLAYRSLQLATRQVAGPALMADGGDLAVAGGANADTLDRRGPMRGVVENQRPRQRHFHRPPDRTRAERREHRVSAHPQLAAEAAADERRYQTDLVLGDAERRGHVARAPVDHLVRGPKRELVPIPGGNRGMRLHHRMRLVRRCVGLIQLDRRCGERAGEITHRSIRYAAAFGSGLGSGILRRREVERTLGPDVVDADQLRGGGCLLEGLRDDHCNCLMIVLDIRAAEQLGGVVLALAELARIRSR